MSRFWLMPFLVFMTGTIFLGCSSEDSNDTIEEVDEDSPLFKLLLPENCGVDFQNTITENFDVNIINYDYLYNGGGVGVGDFNNDGLEDLIFTGNQVADRLYLNKGDLKFQDITASSGLNHSIGWSTGVAIADVNKDGFLDIYVSKSGPSSELADHTNQLFINQGDLTFTEEAVKWGLDYAGHTTQSLFFDMDRDGDLDMYLLTHPSEFNKSLTPQEMQQLIYEGRMESDRLFRNEGDHFVDVSAQSGVTDFAFGLGVACGDLNGDKWPDIYVSNDYDEGDIIYVNNQDGTFTNRVTDMLRHTANYGMGCDIGDFSNDGLADIMSVDMAFETHKRAKMNMASMDQEKFEARVKLGWHFQYMNNMLHLNLGHGRFTEIAQVAGVQKTDWSWSCLFADFDLDGWQDIMVTNGYKRDTKDNDLQHRINVLQESRGGAISIDEALDAIPATRLRNYWFKNNGDYSFDRKSKDWGVDQSVNSNGAAYADLDNDGDLDVVINNVDEVAYVYENTAAREGNHLQVDLISDGWSDGAEVTLHVGDEVMLRRSERQRGYQSSVSDRLHFGLTGSDDPRRVSVLWADGTRESWSLDVGLETVQLEKGSGDSEQPQQDASFRFLYANRPLGIDWFHREISFNDFAQQVLLPHKLSQLGPFLSKGDLNGDGYEDFFVGGAAGQPGVIFMQTATGFAISRSSSLEKDAGFEDMRSAIFDANYDGWNDLLVTSGSQEFQSDEAYLVRLYLNDGKGQLIRDQNFPVIQESIMGLCIEDIDGDDYPDILLGGRMVPGEYLKPPRSYILMNFEGEFRDVTNEVAPEFADIGMVTDIECADLNGDGLKDLLVGGEWMAPTVYIQDGIGAYTIDRSLIPEHQEGWWYSLELRDIDDDGDLDILAGNLGENNKFQPAPGKPLMAYASDFDGNGTHDFVLAKYESSLLVPVRGRECSSEQMPFILDKFPTYEEFANASLEGIYSNEDLQNALTRSVHSFTSGLFRNQNGKFVFEPFPIEAQFAPINDFVTTDLNGDGKLDMIVAGNLYQAEVETTRYDAGSGLVLLQTDNGWECELPGQSGLFAPLDAKDLESVQRADGSYVFIVANNNGPLQAFVLKK